MNDAPADNRDATLPTHGSAPRRKSPAAGVFALATGVLCALAVFTFLLAGVLLDAGRSHTFGEWLVGFGMVGAPGIPLAVAAHRAADGEMSLTWLLAPWLLLGALFGWTLVSNWEGLGLVVFVLSPFAFQAVLRVHDRTPHWSREILRSLALVGSAGLSVAVGWLLALSQAPEAVATALGAPAEVRDALFAAAVSLPPWVTLAALAHATARRLRAAQNVDPGTIS